MSLADQHLGDRHHILNRLGLGICGNQCLLTTDGIADLRVAHDRAGMARTEAKERGAGAGQRFISALAGSARVCLVDGDQRFDVRRLTLENLDESVAVGHRGRIIGDDDEGFVGRTGEPHAVGFDAGAEVEHEMVVLQGKRGKACGQT